MPLFCDTALAKRIERADAQMVAEASEAARRRGADPAGFAIPLAGGLASYAELGSPFNKVAGLGFGGVPSESALAEIEHAYAALGAPAQVEVAHLADPAIGALLTGRGYRLISFENVLGRALDAGYERVTPPGVEVRLSGADELGTWVDIVVEGFAHPDTQGLPSHEEFSLELLERIQRDDSRRPALPRAVRRGPGRRRHGPHRRRHRAVRRRGDRARVPSPGGADRAAVGPARRRRRGRLRHRRRHHGARDQVPAERAAPGLRPALHPRRPAEGALTRPRSALLRSQPGAQADQDASGDRVEPATDARPVEQRPGPGHHDAVHGQPAEREQAEQEPEAEEGHQAAATVPANCGSRPTKKPAIFGLLMSLTSPCGMAPPGRRDGVSRAT